MPISSPSSHRFIVSKYLICQFVYKLIKTQVHLNQETELSIKMFNYIS